MLTKNLATDKQELRMKLLCGSGGKHLNKKIPCCSTLEVYDETPIFVIVDVM